MISAKRVLKLYNLKPIENKFYTHIAVAKIKRESQFKEPISYIVVALKRDITIEKLILKMDPRIQFEDVKNYIEMSNYNAQVDMLTHVDEVDFLCFGKKQFIKLQDARKLLKYINCSYPQEWSLNKEFIADDWIKNSKPTTKPQQSWDFIEYVESTGFKNV